MCNPIQQKGRGLIARAVFLRPPPRYILPASADTSPKQDTNRPEAEQIAFRKTGSQRKPHLPTSLGNKEMA